MEKTLQEEIEYVHSNRLEFKGFAREYSKMRKVVCSATNTYTNLSLFWNDIVKSESFSIVLIRQLNDLYLLALQHIDEDEYQRIKGE